MINNCLIVLNYNDFNTTINFINSIGNYDSVEKIIIVDNFSTNNSFEILEKLKSNKIDVIKTNSNKGYATGNNFGIKYAIEKYKPKYITISNPDVFIEENSIREIVKVLDGNRNIGIATASMMQKTKNGYELSDMKAWKNPGYLYCILASLFLCSKFADRLLMYKPEHFLNEYSYVDAIQGSFFIAKTEALEKINFMDERTFLYCEEIIIGKKMKENNYNTVILNGVTYNHDHGVTINKNITNKINKFKILNESRDIYVRNYLQYNYFKYLLFKISCKIGILERKIIYKVISR